MLLAPSVYVSASEVTVIVAVTTSPTFMAALGIVTLEITGAVLSIV